MWKDTLYFQAYVPHKSLLQLLLFVAVIWVPSPTVFRKISVQFQFLNLNLCGSSYTQKALLGINDMGDIILKFLCFLFPTQAASL